MYTKQIKLNKYYNIISKIDKGAYGSIHLAIRLKDNKKIVLKKHFKHNVNEKELIEEYNTSKLLYHPNIVEYNDIFKDLDDNVYIEMEYLKGNDLWSYMNLKKKNITIHFIRIFLNQIGCALSYIHSIGIAHRDLKLENIFITDIGDFKLVDLGFLCLYNKETTNLKLCDELKGTRVYLSPEMHHDVSFGDDKSDMWALGVLLVELITKKALDDNVRMYKSNNYKQIIGKSKYNSLPKDIRDILDLLLQINPKNRISASTMLSKLNKSVSCDTYYDNSVLNYNTLKKLYEEERYEVIKSMSKLKQIITTKDIKILRIIYSTYKQ